MAWAKAPVKKAIDNLGLHLTLLLYKKGADDQAYDEIFESLKRAKERAKDTPQEFVKDTPREEK